MDANAYAKRIVFFLLFTPLFFSCSKFGRLSENEKVASVTVGTSGPFQHFLTATPQPGGVIIWAKNTSQNLGAAVILASETATYNMNLKFGDWEFFATGWDSAGTFQGTPRCGKVTVNVNSGTSSVTIPIATTGCTDAVFGTQITKNFHYVRCNSLSTVTNGNSSCEGMEIGTLKGIKIEAHSYAPTTIGNAVSTGSISTACIPTGNSTSPGTASNIKFPEGESGSSPIYYRLVGYSDISCTTYVTDIDFKSGLRNSPSVGSAVFYDDPGTSTYNGYKSLFVAYGARPAPNITAVSRSSVGWGGGDDITITGTNFENPVTSVTVGGVACAISSESATSITCTVGRTTTLGATNVVVTNPAGQTGSYAISYVDDNFGNASDSLDANVGTNFPISSGFNATVANTLGTGKQFHSYRNVSNIATTTSGADVAGKTLTLRTAFTAADFAVGDDVLWHVSAGNINTSCDTTPTLNLSQYGYARVAAVDTGNSKITLDSVVTTTPNNTGISNTNRTTGQTFCAIQVVRVPNFKNVTVTAASPVNITTGAFDMTNGYGGILVLKVADTLTLTGANNITISGGGLGYAGGASTTQGTGRIGTGVVGTSANGNGGGGDNGGSTSGSGGGGSGAGANGAGSTAGGNNTCVPSSNCALFGGGGGGGGSGTGGNGGGILLVNARKLVYSGFSGSFVVNADGSSGVGGASGGGGGAGGVAYVQAYVGNSNAIAIDAKAGAGGSGTYSGGGGGGGYSERLHCSSSVVGGTQDVSGGAGYGTGTSGTSTGTGWSSGSGVGNFVCP